MRHKRGRGEGGVNKGVEVKVVVLGGLFRRRRGCRPPFEGDRDAAGALIRCRRNKRIQNNQHRKNRKRRNPTVPLPEENLHMQMFENIN